MAPQNNSDDDHIRHLMDTFSAIVAIAEQMKTCPIHECCDGSCAGRQIVNEPLLGASLGVIVSRRPQPRYLPTSIIYHNQAWLAEQHLELFEYTPINSGRAMIRLLRIKSANFRNDVVECGIFDACLDDNPVFAVLSYYWGPPCFDHQMICNGNVRSITGTFRLGT